MRLLYLLSLAALLIALPIGGCTGDTFTVVQCEPTHYDNGYGCVCQVGKTDNGNKSDPCVSASGGSAGESGAAGMVTSLGGSAGENGAAGQSVASGGSAGQPAEQVAAARISAGISKSCVIPAQGTVRCWGWNKYGELGDGTTVNAPTPTYVRDIVVAAQGIALGNEVTCALTAQGRVLCWGRNNFGQLGDATTSDSQTPREVRSLLTTSVAVTAADAFACALAAEGGVSCWGKNQWGNLGNGTNTNSSTPVSVLGISDATQIAAASSQVCARRRAGTVSCWGLFGGGDRTPVDVAGLTTATSVIVGNTVMCARLASGDVQCWGGNDAGQLGDGTTTSRSAPGPLVALSGKKALAITAGYSHACALTEDKQVLCWGNGLSGQLGNGESANSATPVAVKNLFADPIAIAAGDWHTCALAASGAVACWGKNDAGQLGNGTTTYSSTPVVVTGL